jgi:hypothetical protein
MDVFWLIVLIIVTLLFTVIVSTAIASEDIQSTAQLIAEELNLTNAQTEKLVKILQKKW